MRVVCDLFSLARYLAMGQQGEEGPRAVALASGGDDLGADGDEKGDHEVNNGKRFWWNDGVKALKTLLKGFKNLTAEVSAATKQFRQLVEILLRFQVALRRIQLEVVLMRRWHVPNDVAYWLSQRWPRRWLPELRIDLGMGRRGG